MRKMNGAPCPLHGVRGDRPLSEIAGSWERIPEGLRREIEAQLEAGESLLACFAPDLNERLSLRRG